MAVVSNGRMFVRTDKEAACLDVAAQASAMPAKVAVRSGRLVVECMVVITFLKCVSHSARTDEGGLGRTVDGPEGGVKPPGNLMTSSLAISSS